MVCNFEKKYNNLKTTNIKNVVYYLRSMKSIELSKKVMEKVINYCILGKTKVKSVLK